MSKFGRYAFSDSELAEQRLKLVADTFSESTSSFLRDVVDGPTRLAIDLGCGPGYTTRLLADTTGCERAIGLDESPRTSIPQCTTRMNKSHFWYTMSPKFLFLSAQRTSSIAAFC